MYLLILESWERKTKDIFIPDEYQGSGWWLFMVAAFELADQKFVNLDSKKCSERKVVVSSGRTLIRDEHRTFYFSCPYCEAVIQYSKVLGGG